MNKNKRNTKYSLNREKAQLNPYLKKEQNTSKRMNEKLNHLSKNLFFFLPNFEIKNKKIENVFEVFSLFWKMFVVFFNFLHAKKE